MNIRPYQDSDLRLFQQLVYQAQERDCQLDRWMATAQRMLGDYLTGLFEDLRKFDGIIFVAESDETGDGVEPATLGFVSVLGACTEHDVDEADHVFGFITDLVISDDADSSNVASALIDAAGQHAARCGSEVLRSSVLARNVDLLAHYRTHGFNDRLLQFEKSVKDGG